MNAAAGIKSHGQVQKNSKNSGPEDPVPALKRGTMETEDDFRQLIFNISHDLRGHIGKVVTFSELLSDKLRNLDAIDKDYLMKIEESGKRMRMLIESLARYARFSKISGESENLAVENLCTEVLSDMEQEIRKSGAKIKVKNSGKIKGEHVQMKFIFQNLFENAIKFSKQGMDPEITVMSRSEGPVTEITVSDNGMGFEEKDAQRVFEPFQTLHPKGSYPGTGIGLSIVDRIVRNHGGTITAKSKAGLGTNFVIRLPNA